MKVYYARPVTHYGTDVDNAILHILKNTDDVEVVDPQNYEEEYKKQGMDVFLNLVDECDMVVYNAFGDGAIGAGVAKEIERAEQNDKPALLITKLSMSLERAGEDPKKLSVAETRKYIKDGTK